MDQVTRKAGGRFIEDVMENVQVRESFLKDLLNVMNNVGLITPQDGQIKIEAIDNTISIYIPVDEGVRKTSF